MGNLNTAIIYYSSTGVNHQMATWAAEKAEETGSAVRLRRVAETAPEEVIQENPAWKKHYEESRDVEEATMDDLEWADVIIFSAPTRYGNLPAQMKQFLDSTGGLWQEGKLVNKVVTGMTSAMNPHGGQEETLRALYTTMHHWGAIVVSPGYSADEVFASGGNPYGTSATVDMEGNITDDNEAIKNVVYHQAERAIEIGRKVNAEVEEYA